MRFVFLNQAEQIAQAWKNLNHAFSPPLETVIADLNIYAEKLAAYGCTIACIDHCDSILGCISFYANDTINHTAYIAEFAVNNINKKHGIGTKLINRAYDESINRGMSTIRLEVRKNNDSARVFYKKQGFVLTEEKSTTLILERPLTAST